MFNEEGNVGEIVREVRKTLRENRYDADIVIVDDGSEDGTLFEIERVRQSFAGIVVRKHEKNLGFGAAVRTAMEAARAGGYDFIVFMDADFTMHPEYIEAFYSKLEEGYDFVIGSRFIAGGGMRDVPWYRKAVSVLGRVVLGICFRLPISDYTQGFRAIRTTLIGKMKLTESGFPILIQEIFEARKHTNKFSEISFVLTGRKTGRSKFSYTPKVLWDYLKYAFRALVEG